MDADKIKHANRWKDTTATCTQPNDTRRPSQARYGIGIGTGDWNGVTVSDGRVTGLTLEKCSRIDGLDVIDSIEELESMSWCTKLVALPEAVRRLRVLEELYFVDPANDSTGAAEEADEEAQPSALPCFGSSSGDTPSSPCPEPSSRNLRGRR